MAITDPAAVRFANEVIRPLANQYARLYYQIKTAANQYTALDMTNKFTAGGGAVEDGSDADGRPRITADDVRAFATQMGSLMTDLEASTNAKLNGLLKIAPNPRG